MKQQIICLSTSNWHPFPTRKQQVMSRLKNAEILYFEPPITYLAPYKDASAKPRLTSFKAQGEQVTNSVRVYATPPMLPLFNKLRAVNKLNQRKLAKFVRGVMRENGFQKPLLWVYSPTAADITDHIPHEGLVYDCVDRHSAYKGLINPAVVDGMEADLARRADTVFTTAKGLYDTLQAYNKRTFLVPNGANFELFNTVDTKTYPVPEKLQGIKHPIIGFVGGLQECIDYQLVRHGALEKPDWTFVFVGKLLPGVDLSPISGLPNVKLLDVVPHTELPGYLAQFDVCLNLFRSGALAQDVSPLKFYEYLATGKPIVSTLQPLQVLDYADVIQIAASGPEFVACCQSAMEDSPASQSAKRQRIAYGRAASWDARVMEIERILAEQ